MGLKSALGLKKIPITQNPFQVLLFPRIYWFILAKFIYALQHFYLEKKRTLKYLFTQWKSIIHAYKGAALKTVPNSIQRSWKLLSSITKGHSYDSVVSDYLHKSRVSHKAAILYISYIKVWGLSGWLKENITLSPMLITQQCNSKKIQLKIEYAFVHSWCPVQLQEGFSF